MNNNLIRENLTKLLSNAKGDFFYPCIQDLVDNGLDLTRFTLTEPLPSRQEITQYLAAWCKDAGLTDEECQGWLIEYCVNTLSVISKTSASGIRHSTKSNIKYIYRANVQFLCGRKSNQFKAQCRKSCPVYSEIKNKTAEKTDQVHDIGCAVEKTREITEICHGSVKEKFEDQFKEALRFIRSQIEIGTKKPKIINQLNERGLKTKTGRLWTYSTLHRELNTGEWNSTS